eukprot:scaffold319218_cov33-Tisochrysis_lutea.AAC.2
MTFLTLRQVFARLWNREVKKDIPVRSRSISADSDRLSLGGAKYELEAPLVMCKPPLAVESPPTWPRGLPVRQPKSMLSSPTVLSWEDPQAKGSETCPSVLPTLNTSE